MTWSPLRDQTHPLCSVRLESYVRKLRQLIFSFIIYHNHLKADKHVSTSAMCLYIGG